MRPNVSSKMLNVTLEGHDFTSNMILGFNYLNLCKNWIFHVSWPCQPFDDLKLIKGHNYCINRELKLSFFHD
jgi:hypothetical protein